MKENIFVFHSRQTMLIAHSLTRFMFPSSESMIILIDFRFYRAISPLLLYFRILRKEVLTACSFFVFVSPNTFSNHITWLKKVQLYYPFKPFSNFRFVSYGTLQYYLYRFVPFDRQKGT